MKCNNCNLEMKEGTTAVKATGWGFVFFGLSYKHLFFKLKGTNKKEEILKNNQLATAYQCPSCKATTIMPDGERRNLVHW